MIERSSCSSEEEDVPGLVLEPLLIIPSHIIELALVTSLRSCWPPTWENINTDLLAGYFLKMDVSASVSKVILLCDFSFPMKS